MVRAACGAAVLVLAVVWYVLVLLPDVMGEV
jgi:hypothetical protein